MSGANKQNNCKGFSIFSIFVQSLSSCFPVSVCVRVYAIGFSLGILFGLVG